MKIPKEKQKDIYVDPKLFAEKYDEWKQNLLYNRENGLPDPKITEYLGECILKICTRLTYSPCFYNYTWKDTMTTNALENCIKYFDRFNKDAISKRTGKKTAGPFAYFTSIAFSAFIRTINLEKKEIDIKKKYIKNMSPIIQEIIGTEVEEYDIEYISYLQNLLDDEEKEKQNNVGSKFEKEDISNFYGIDNEIEIDQDVVSELMDHQEDLDE